MSQTPPRLSFPPTTGSVFGPKPAQSNPFGQTPGPTPTLPAPFGQKPAQSNPFGQTAGPTPAAPFGQKPGATPAAPFGQNPSGTAPFGTKSAAAPTGTTPTTVSPLFDAKPAAGSTATPIPTPGSFSFGGAASKPGTTPAKTGLSFGASGNPYRAGKFDEALKPKAAAVSQTETPTVSKAPKVQQTSAEEPSPWADPQEKRKLLREFLGFDRIDGVPLSDISWYVPPGIVIVSKDEKKDD
jgi:hypothetical protein